MTSELYSTASIISECLDNLETAIPDFKLTGNTLLERFESLSNAKSDKVMSLLIKERASFDQGFYKKVFSELTVDELPENFKIQSVKWLATMLIQAHISHPSFSEKTTRQHWLPVCYSRNFAKKVSNRRICSYDVVVSKDDRLSEEEKNDKNFLHYPTADSEGRNTVRFYESMVEEFFGHVESHYANSVLRLLEQDYKPTSFDYVVCYVFAYIQESRKPKADGTFRYRTLGELLMTICEIFDHLDTVSVKFLFPDFKLAITPNETVRLFRSSGKETVLFPLASHIALVVSDSELTITDGLRVLSRERSSYRSRVKRGSSLYGVSISDVE